MTFMLRSALACRWEQFLFRPPSAKLHGSKDRYKIKLRSIGYRLVYEVRDAEVVVLVIAIGRRDRSEVYRVADIR
ncbi:MAG: type II toxin-antitoxin system RelE/ParE family toxin [Rhizobiaceae bacterium]|nr:type II toxin-antitoxin system RelE/ParE family toxin [Rhizobiaceae bacterium]